MDLLKLHYIFWNFLPSLFQIRVGHKRQFWLVIRSKQVKQQPYFLCSEGGCGRLKRCFCSSHLLSFICWLHWLAWGSSWAYDFSTIPWIFLQHLRSLGHVSAYLQDGSISFTCELGRVRTDTCSRLSSWAPAHTCGFQLAFCLSHFIPFFFFLPNCLPCTLQAPASDAKSIGLHRLL